jgi:hypothetical protein
VALSFMAANTRAVPLPPGLCRATGDRWTCVASAAHQQCLLRRDDRSRSTLRHTRSRGSRVRRETVVSQLSVARLPDSNTGREPSNGSAKRSAGSKKGVFLRAKGFSDRGTHFTRRDPAIEFFSQKIIRAPRKWKAISNAGQSRSTSAVVRPANRRAARWHLACSVV